MLRCGKGRLAIVHLQSKNPSLWVPFNSAIYNQVKPVVNFVSTSYIWYHVVLHRNNRLLHALGKQRPLSSHMLGDSPHMHVSTWALR